MQEYKITILEKDDKINLKKLIESNFVYYFEDGKIIPIKQRYKISNEKEISHTELDKFLF